MARMANFLARIVAGAKGGAKRITLKLESQQRPPEAAGDLTLAFAPLRRHRLESMLEKACELGGGAPLPCHYRIHAESAP